MQQAKTIIHKDAGVAALKTHNAALDARLAVLEQALERLTKQQGRQEK